VIAARPMAIEILTISSTKDALIPQRLFSRGAPLAVQPKDFEFVSKIAEEVAAKGDDAVLDITSRYDKAHFASPLVSEETKATAIASIGDDVRRAIRHAIKNARTFNETIMKQQRFEMFAVEEGVSAALKAWPVRSAALYVPCGKGAYPSSFITIAVPALVAGVPNIEVLIPPKQDGTVDGAVLFAAQELGLKRIYCGNGIAVTVAAALGTKSLPAVDKIVGPGGPGIMAAQTYAATLGVDVAKHFGPSECMIIADESADPELIAADLLNEAEHGPESSAMLVTTSRTLGEQVSQHLSAKLQEVPEFRRAYADSALNNGAILIVPDLSVAVDVANELANEHIQVICKDAERIAARLYGGAEVLIGQDTTFSAISYAIGVPACLPTGPSARRFSGVTALTYLRYSAVTSLTRAGLRTLAPTIVDLASYEGFPSHAESIAVRRRRGLI
jgi:histidinol dehydrogenase